MAFLLITLEELPSKMIRFDTLSKAFDKCVPYDCPSRSRFWRSFPERSWTPVHTDDIPMERVAKVICNCLPTSGDIGRFAMFLTGEQVASYEVLLEYLTQTFVRA